ncbi:MAG: bifunctional diaminohydroxyphosphoribosylaminopyrimidine deaminase/5-amino-6-(5-phosphoribosylamino)uracil reductase RibD, partial [Marinobacterium sp.]
GFLSRMERGRPFVRLKLATSIDGRTAMASGESQWITGPEARADVQRLRARSSAVITGVGSVLQDDSALTVREAQLPASVVPLTEGRQPLRVVLDSQGRLPASAQMLALPGRTLQVVAANNCNPLEGAEQVQLANEAGRIDLPQLLSYLAEKESCNEVLVECGAQLAGAMLAAGLVDELVHYMAPKLMGSDARPLAELPLTEMSEAIEMKLKDVRQFGHDLRMTWTV